MSYNQAIMAARAGANFVSLFWGRIRDIGSFVSATEPHREIELWVRDIVLGLRPGPGRHERGPCRARCCFEERLVSDYFAVFELPRKLAVDGDALQRRFYELSRRHHPDFHQGASAEAQGEALATSALVNRAYRALRDPLARVEYLVALEGGATVRGRARRGSPARRGPPRGDDGSAGRAGWRRGPPGSARRARAR